MDEPLEDGAAAAHARPAATADRPAAAPAPGAEPAPLPSPAALRRALPPGVAAAETVARTRAALRDALHGRDPARLVVVVGPCSLHDPDAAREYAARLAATARTHADVLVVVMRTYFEKPRTALGWKGLLHDPHLDGSGDVAEGLRRTRRLLCDVGALGLACGAELLDPLAAPYLADLLAWASLGARTVESQVHRQMASGLDLPVGFKNTVDGRLQPAADAARAASRGHAVLALDAAGRAAVARTPGNPDGHLVLRGGEDGPNHRGASLAAALREAAALGLQRGVLVDCSHGNSGKRAAAQPAVCREVLEEVRDGAAGVLGVMLESHLEAGRQDPETRPLRYGVSITDACLGWADTEPLLGELADAVRRGRPPAARRNRPGPRGGSGEDTACAAL